MYMCLWVSGLPIFTNYLLNFETVPTLYYNLFLILFQKVFFPYLQAWISNGNIQ